MIAKERERERPAKNSLSGLSATELLHRECASCVSIDCAALLCILARRYLTIREYIKGFSAYINGSARSRKEIGSSALSCLLCVYLLLLLLTHSRAHTSGTCHHVGRFFFFFIFVLFLLFAVNAFATDASNLRLDRFFFLSFFFFVPL